MIQIAIILMILGTVFAVTEMLIPGFGFFGIMSVLAFISSWIITILYIPYGIYIAIMEAAFVITLFFSIVNYLKGKNLKGTIILDESLAEDVKENNSDFVGREGTAKTSLKPFGKADFSGNIVDVCAEEFIEKGKSVKAIKYNDGKLYVVSAGK